MRHRPRGEDQPERKGDPDKRLVFVLFRYFKYWDQGELSQAANISQSQVSLYDQGHQTVPDDALARTAKAVGFPVFLLPFLLKAVRAFRLLAEGKWTARKALGGDLAASLLGLGQSIAEAVVEPGLPHERETLSPEEEREAARALWERLRIRAHSYRTALVEEDEDYQTWALCERVAAASIESAGDDPREALRRAELAVRISKICPGAKAWRWRLEGYAGIHLANAWNACGDLPAAREALTRGKNLWEAGAYGDPAGLLDEAPVLQIEASLPPPQRTSKTPSTSTATP